MIDVFLVSILVIFLVDTINPINEIKNNGINIRKLKSNSLANKILLTKGVIIDNTKIMRSTFFLILSFFL